MIKELKFFLYIVTIIGFVFFIPTKYFSDENKKRNYKADLIIKKKIVNFSNNLKVLNSDTDNITEYVENISTNKKKKYKFWDLLTND